MTAFSDGADIREGDNDTSQPKKYAVIGVFSQVIVVVLFGCCATMMTVALSKMVKAFLAEPVASDVTVEFPTEFPVVTFCPRGWADPQKIVAYNVSRDVLRYAVSLLPVVRDFKYLGSLDLLLPDTEETDREGRRIKRDYLAFMHSSPFESLEELISNLMVDPVDILGETARGNEGFILTPRFNITPIVTMDTPCYRFDAPTVQLTMLLSLTRRIKFAINFQQAVGPLSSGRLFIGDLGPTVLPKGDEVTIRANHVYNFNLKVTKFVLTTTVSKKCSSNESKEQYDCLISCANTEACAGLCQMFHPGFVSGRKDQNLPCSRFEFGTPRHCMTPHNGSESRTFETACITKCPASCIRSSYSHSVRIQSGARHNTSSTLLFGFADPGNSILVQTQPVYSFESFFCNIGGVISLFLGMSVFSLARGLSQAVYALVVGWKLLPNCCN